MAPSRGGSGAQPVQQHPGKCWGSAGGLSTLAEKMDNRNEVSKGFLFRSLKGQPQEEGTGLKKKKSSTLKHNFNDTAEVWENAKKQ